MERHTLPVEQLASKFLRGLKPPKEALAAVMPAIRQDNGWYKTQFPLAFDNVRISPGVDQWLSKVRGALRNPDSRVLIAGCQKRNVDPGGQFGLVDHPRVIWWENPGDRNNDRWLRAAIPSRVGIVFTGRWASHPLTDSLQTQGRARQIPVLAPIGRHDLKTLIQLGLMEEAELEKRLRPIIPSAVQRLMESASTVGATTSKVMLEGQLHKVIVGDELPTPLEPVPEAPPIFSPTGELMPRKPTNDNRHKQGLTAPRGAIQRFLSEHDAIADDRNLSFAEATRQLLDKAHKAGHKNVSSGSLPQAVRQYRLNKDKDKASQEVSDEASQEVSVAPGSKPVEPVVSTPVVETPHVETAIAPRRSSLVATGAVQRIVDSIHEGRRYCKQAEDLAKQAADAYALGSTAFDDVEKELANLDADLRARALRALQAEFQP